MRILIAVPTFENISPPTFRSIYRLDRGGHDLDFDFVRGYDCAKARNEIANRAMSGGFDSVLMVDSDIELPSDALTRLASAGRDVILGWYIHRPKNGPGDERSSLYLDSYSKPMSVEDVMGYNAPFKVHGGGFGCALVTTRVFKAVQYPWFNYVKYRNRTFLSEDLHFCSACEKARIDIWAEPGVRCGHEVRFVRYPE